MLPRVEGSTLLSKQYYRVLINSKGPILFTAPHGVDVLRPNNPKHYAEKNTTESATLLQQTIGDELGSYLTWNPARCRSGEPCNLDPNYLTLRNFADSPWHVELEKHKSKHTHPFHVDLHGCKKPKPGKPITLHIGLLPLEELWEDEKFSAQVAQVSEKHFNKLLAPKGWIATTDTYFSGMWAQTNHTMTHQAVMLGKVYL